MPQVSSTCFVKSVEKIDQSIHWTIYFDAKKGTIQCSYGKFDMMGLQYSYCMRVIRQLDIVNIPSKYVLLIWSARARKDIYVAARSLVWG
ncbi:hypothetical protein IEQ34_017519 [Dendrobium chrysotoxum]|uniref:Uncharacterized protein n=1 Tax=Dendrobium chrysotoxum TaxID=161865 RepID=A0AAV7FU10_DENCH|nr:hypothetical protein IEQ34_017519 [Dendrobium chrysotoxum]